MKTFGCNFSADVFAQFFELVIVPDIIKLNNGQYYEAHYTCCTFNTRRQNTRKGLTRIQIAPCCKINFAKDWSFYWFYPKVDMSAIPGYDEAFSRTLPLHDGILAITKPFTRTFLFHDGILAIKEPFI
jgi:hypothetical protein